MTVMVRKACLGACLAVSIQGFMACTDDYTLDDPDNYPSWLGSSIYDAMKNPESLTNAQGSVLKGTFSTICA